MPPKVMHGARAKVGIVDPATGKARIVGIWNNFSYQVALDVQPSFILGRYTPAELTTTGMEPVSIQAQGWRVVDHGAYAEAGITNLKDLLFQEYLTLTVIDRQTNKNVATIRGCLPTGYSSTYSARQLAELPCSFMGLIAEDEFGSQDEAASASNLP